MNSNVIKEIIYCNHMKSLQVKFLFISGKAVVLFNMSLCLNMNKSVRKLQDSTAFIVLWLSKYQGHI
jgi:hypothetical protein